jgi:hypothetical protein
MYLLYCIKKNKCKKSGIRPPNLKKKSFKKTPINDGLKKYKGENAVWASTSILRNFSIPLKSALKASNIIQYVRKGFAYERKCAKK